MEAIARAWNIRRHLVGDLAEHSTRASALVAEPATLDPHQLHRPSHQQVPHPLAPLGVHPHGEHSAHRTPRWRGALDLDPASALGVLHDGGHPVVGQVEDRARSITLRARRLERGSWTSK
jgi:hypothetical protein